MKFNLDFHAKFGSSNGAEMALFFRDTATKPSFTFTPLQHAPPFFVYASGAVALKMTQVPGTCCTYLHTKVAFSNLLTCLLYRMPTLDLQPTVRASSSLHFEHSSATCLLTLGLQPTVRASSSLHFEHSSAACLLTLGHAEFVWYCSSFFSHVTFWVFLSYIWTLFYI